MMQDCGAAILAAPEYLLTSSSSSSFFLQAWKWKCYIFLYREVYTIFITFFEGAFEVFFLQYGVYFDIMCIYIIIILLKKIYYNSEFQSELFISINFICHSNSNKYVDFVFCFQAHRHIPFNTSFLYWTHRHPSTHSFQHIIPLLNTPSPFNTFLQHIIVSYWTLSHSLSVDFVTVHKRPCIMSWIVYLVVCCDVNNGGGGEGGVLLSQPHTHTHTHTHGNFDDN